MTTQEREALQDCVGALQFILSFYEPGQRHLDTEAWKRACAGGVRAYTNGAALIDWTIRPMKAVDGAVYFTASADRSGEAGETRSEAKGLDPKDESAVGAEGDETPKRSSHA